MAQDPHLDPHHNPRQITQYPRQVMLQYQASLQSLIPFQQNSMPTLSLLNRITTSQKSMAMFKPTAKINTECFNNNIF